MKKILKIGNVGSFSRLPDGNYKKHATRINMMEVKLDLEKLAYLILENSRWYFPEEIKNELKDFGWVDVVNVVQKLEKTKEIKNNREIVKIESQITKFIEIKNKIEYAVTFQKYFENWLKTNEGKYTNKIIFNNITEKEYWAARELSYEELDVSIGEDNESCGVDISVRRLHQSALHNLSIWTENKNKDLNAVLEEIKKLKREKKNFPIRIK